MSRAGGGALSAHESWLRFHRTLLFARVPYLTVALVLVLLAVYLLWQEGGPASLDDLVRRGAKSQTLMVELGQWWRLLTANLLHQSPWHLGVNLFFLFNLGGPLEAVLRRGDYALVLGAAGLGASLASFVLNPEPSFGASGLVFGVWGAAALFGLRYRTSLPPRYRRYYLGAVLPYALVALYTGFTVDGVDNWAHLGGLCAGGAASLACPARLLVDGDRRARLKLALVGLVLVAIAGASALPQGVGELRRHRYYPAGGLVVPVPRRWQEVTDARDAHAEAHAFANGVAVTIGLQTTREPAWQPDPILLAEAFVVNDMARHLDEARAKGLRLSDPTPTTVAGLPAAELRADILTPHLLVRATYLVVGRGFYRHVVSFTAPAWLAEAYAPVWAAIRADLQLIEPNELSAARRAVLGDDTPWRHAELGVALAHAGQLAEAEALFVAATARWPDNLSLWEARIELARQLPAWRAPLCGALRGVWRRQSGASWYALMVEALELCGEAEEAAALLREARRRFPGAASWGVR